MIALAWLLSVMAAIPAECTLYGQCPTDTLAGSDRTRDAREVAHAVVLADLTPEESIEAVVYAAYESGYRLDATGDGGRSHGAWQIGIDGLDARGQLAHWRRLRSYSLARCSDSPEDQRMALLASGRCARGTVKVSRRARVVADLADRFR